MPPFLYRLALGISLLTAGAAPATTASRPSPPEAPRVFWWSAQTLVETRAQLRQSGTPSPALRQLFKDATAALALRPPSVLAKSLTAASGDKHDYFSMGPYWWPDPAKPDGLPYIRRDGDVNPASRQGTDYVALGDLIEAVETLTLAYWYSGDERYASKAALMVRVWFLDPATRMNPNLQHAQAIPGITPGRGIGLIETHRLPALNDGLALLARSPAWPESEQQALRAWMTEFYGWLTTSQNGRDESAERNNHGTWYDFQTAHLALVLGRDDDARQLLQAGLAKRIELQVQPDGSQPLELARTKSLGYSVYNLAALFSCARLGEHVGVDWWNFTTTDGRSLQAALAYLAPYTDPEKQWVKQDLHETRREEIVPLLFQYLHHRDAPLLRDLAARFAGETISARWRLCHDVRAAPLRATLPDPVAKTSP